MNLPFRADADSRSDNLVYRQGISPAGDDALEYVLSDETEDSYGDVISSAGWNLAEFKKHPIALFNHDRFAIIGRWANVRVESGRLLGRLELVRAGTSALTDYIRELVEQKVLRAVSVGFRPLRHEPLGTGKNGVRFLQQLLKEASLVAVPANPNALQIARSLGLSADDTAAIHGKFAQVDRRSSVATNGKLAKPLSQARETMSTTKLGKRIQDAQADITRLRDQLTALSEKDERNDEENVQFEELPNQITEARKRLETLENAERALATTVARDEGDGGGNGGGDQQRQIQVGSGQRPFAVPKKKVAPGDFLIRAAACIAVSRLQQLPLERVLANLYGNDEPTGIILRAAVNPATTTAPGWAAELVETVIGDFLDTLKPVSIYPKIAAMGARFTFGRAGFIKVPSRTSTPTLAGSWVGEGAPKPVRRLGLTSITLSPTKLAVISFFTEELAEHSTPAIEGIIRDAMRDDTAASIDGYLLDNVAASAVRPAGLLNGVTGLTPSAATEPAVAMVEDLKALAMEIVSANGGRSIVFLVNPVQAIGIGFAQSTSGEFIFDSPDQAFSKLGATFISSNSVPAGTVVALDAADFASATGDVPRFSVSDQATIHADDAPTAIGTVGTPNVVAAPVRSLWQEDLIGIRMHWPITWAMRRAGMVAFVAGVSW